MKVPAKQKENPRGGSVEAIREAAADSRTSPESVAKVADQTHDDGPADGSRHGGKLSTSPHSRPSTRNRQV